MRKYKRLIGPSPDIIMGQWLVITRAGNETPRSLKFHNHAEGPPRPSSLLKADTTIFRLRNVLRHYAKWVLLIFIYYPNPLRRSEVEALPLLVLVQTDTVVGALWLLNDFNNVNFCCSILLTAAIFAASSPNKSEYSGMC